MSVPLKNALSLEPAERAAPARREPLVIDTIDGLERFRALRQEWNELLRETSSHRLFLTWEWMYTWCRHLLEDRRLRLITVRCDGKLAAIAPLALRPSRFRRLLPFPALEFLGMGSVGSDYLDLLVRRGVEDDVLRVLSNYLTEHEFILDLSRVEAATAHSNALALQLRQRGWGAKTTPTDTCPLIDLSRHTWESYLAGLGSTHRYNFRRRLRSLEKQWRVRFEQARSEGQRAEFMRVLIALHRQRWRQRGCPGAFHTPALVAFHEELSRLALQQGWLRLYVLWLDDRPAAALYGFSYDGTFYFYQSGFDPTLGKHSVGLVLTGLAIRSAIEEGAQVYDFLRGDEPYKFLWAREERKLIRLELFPPCVRGRFFRQAMEVRHGIKKLFGVATVADPSALP